MLLSARNAKRCGRTASAGIVAQLIGEGLATSGKDVVVCDDEVYVRARLPDGKPAAFFQFVGPIYEERA